MKKTSTKATGSLQSNRRKSNKVEDQPENKSRQAEIYARRRRTVSYQQRYATPSKQAVRCLDNKKSRPPLDHDSRQLVGICATQRPLVAAKKLLLKRQILVCNHSVGWLLSMAVLAAAVAAE